MSLAEFAAGDNSTAAFDVEQVRADFPILRQSVYGRPLVYLDNAASAQKPRQVIDAMSEAYETYYANVHRGVHHLSQRSTEGFEAGREKLAAHINAASMDEVIFTRNGSEAINLVAASYGRRFLEAGDEIIISEMEHHSNIVPWHLLCAEKGVVLKAAPIDDEGNLRLDALEALIGPRTKLIAITHISNALGTINPIKEIVRLAHARDIPVLVDGCQAAPHLKIDVRDLDADFYVMTGHKMYGPSGIGALYGKMDLLKKMPPYQGGGEMIDVVTIEKSTFKEPPHRFEAGTPAIVEAIGLGAAVDYLNAIGLDNVAAHENGLTAYAMERLRAIEGIVLYGTAKEKTSIVSFNFDGTHAHDVGTILDRAGIAVRAGHHCAQPLMERLGVGATARASFAMYNTREEIDGLVEGLGTVREIFG